MEKSSYAPASFMVISIIGLLISALWIYNISKPYGFAFTIVFAAMLGASIVNMTHSSLEPEIKHRNK